MPFYAFVRRYDLASTYYNEQLGEVFETITKTTAKKQVMHGWGVTNHVSSGTYESISNALKITTPANVNKTLNSKENSVAVGVYRANKDLQRIV